MDFFSALQQSPVIMIFFALVLGLVVGSFLNVVILRLPPMLEFAWKKDYAEFTESEFSETPPPSLAFTRSHCPKCKKQLKFFHNIPVLSYLFLRGRCAFCDKSISVRYPLIELLSGIVVAFLAYKYGLSLQFLAVVLLFWFLLVITWIDIDTYLIPDQLSLTLLWLGLFFSLFEFSVAVEVAVIGALVGYLSLWVVFQVFKILTGKEGMGYGDFKLLSAAGAWLGYEPLIIVLLLASVSGLVVALLQKIAGTYEQKIPFGPYLSIGFFVAYLFGAEIHQLLFALPQ